MNRTGPIADIVIPVYNEHENIGSALKRIVDEVEIPYRVSIVYDFDEDTTIPAAKKAALDLGIDLGLIRNRYGRGALQAIKTGLHATDSQYVVVTMADLSDPPFVINDMYRKAEANNADLICGSRYMKGGSQSGGPLFKKLMSKTAGLTLHWICGIPTHDATNSFKLYRRNLIDEIEIESRGGFEIGLELTVKAFVGGYKIGEVPTSWEDRAAGESRFQLRKWLPLYLRWYMMAMRKSLLRQARPAIAASQNESNAPS